MQWPFYRQSYVFLFLLRKKFPNTSQKLRWRSQKLVYMNQKSAGRKDGILACYTELFFKKKNNMYDNLRSLHFLWTFDIA